ncbi:MAG: c-type cytochrome [Acidimicrobiia bacterium]|nr:c-type cytochrome [Acidimicrobiia bacterium]
MRQRIVVFLALLIVAVCFPHPAFADHLILEVTGPDQAAAGEEIEITVSVRQASTGWPVEGASVVFFGDAFFAGVTGEIRLGSATTNRIGVATFTTAFTVRGVHKVRVEVEDQPDTDAGTVTVGVGIGSQIVETEVGVEIPGLGSWLVTVVIGSVWVIMIVAVLWLVRVSRSGKREDPDPGPGRSRRLGRRFNLAPLVAVAMISLAMGLVVLLLRSPDTHHNLDPTGYDRSPVAYLDAAYFYPGPGLAGGVLSGDAVTDGRALFLKLGCAGCHGLNAQGAASAPSPAFATKPWLETVMRTGLPGGMPAYPDTEVSVAEIDALHAFLIDARDALAGEERVTTTTTTTTEASSTTTTAATEVLAPTFAEVVAVLEPSCGRCHGGFGGWSMDDYESFVNSGDNGPVVLPGDPDGSLLAQKLLGTQTSGSVMPPSGALPPDEIQLVIDWISAGAEP